MKTVKLTILVILVSLSSSAQNINLDDKISYQDSVLLQKFWMDFTMAIQNSNKVDLALLCDFPFYCRPCIDDTTIKIVNLETVKVTKKLFYKSQHKVFFSTEIKNEIERQKKNRWQIFSPSFDDKNKRNGFMFSYTIVAPSKKREGRQGFIYLKKVGNKFKIDGIDIVP